MMATADTLLTAQQFLHLPDNGMIQELVRGTVIEMPLPGFRHGKVCRRFSRLIGDYVEDNDLGHVLTNDSGVITERGPDTVRGPDVAIYLYDRVSKDAEIAGYPDAAPNLVVEVLSPDDRWPRVHGKVGEYLSAGVTVVCVADPDARTVSVFRADQAPATLAGEQTLALPDVLVDFRASINQLFD